MNRVCVNCFSDKEIKAFINALSIKGKCDCCDSIDIDTIEISELYDFFQELFNNFKLYEEGEALKNKIQGYWNFFSTLDNADKILNSVIGEIETEILSADDRVDFTDDIYENINYWDKLKEQLMWERRYLTDVNYLTDELSWDSFFNSQIILSKATELYRARLHHVSNEEPYHESNMFCPDKTKASAGRANPNGIPFLYLSDNEETILYEIRASYLDEVSIGRFKVRDDLNQPVLIADFTENPTIFHPSRVGEKIKSMLLKQKISNDLSKPMRRYDLELDYIPTQFICEFIKVFTGVNGIKFRSSLHTRGNNIVIFDQTIMQCVDVKKVKVKRVKINT